MVAAERRCSYAEPSRLRLAMPPPSKKRFAGEDLRYRGIVPATTSRRRWFVAYRRDQNHDWSRCSFPEAARWRRNVRNRPTIRLYSHDVQRQREFNRPGIAIGLRAIVLFGAVVYAATKVGQPGSWVALAPLAIVTAAFAVPAARRWRP